MSKLQTEELKTNKTSTHKADELPSGSKDLDKRRATVPHILKPQQSFEKRYSQMINRQILETSINRRVLQRQVNVFFGFPASPTKTTPDEEFPPEKESDELKIASSELLSKDV